MSDAAIRKFEEDENCLIELNRSKETPTHDHSSIAIRQKKDVIAWEHCHFTGNVRRTVFNKNICRIKSINTITSYQSYFIIYVDIFRKVNQRHDKIDVIKKTRNLQKGAYQLINHIINVIFRSQVTYEFEMVRSAHGLTRAIYILRPDILPWFLEFGEIRPNKATPCLANIIHHQVPMDTMIQGNMKIFSQRIVEIWPGFEK